MPVEQQKEQGGHHQVIQGCKQRAQSQEQQPIHIGGENCQLVEQEDKEEQIEGQQPVLKQEQAQQLRMLEQKQLIFSIIFNNTN